MVRWSFYPIGDSNYLLVAGVAFVLLALVLWVGPPGERIGPRRRRILTALRVAAVLLIVLLMLRPTVVYTTTEPRAATVAILADSSRSMTVSDEAGGATRWEMLQNVLATSKDRLAQLGRRFELAAYAFDEQLQPLAISDGRIALPAECTGDQTALGAALEDLLQREAGKRLLAVLLLSDGAQRALPPRDTLPQTAAAQLKHQECPVFAFRLGQPHGLGPARDVAVVDLVVPQHVFAKNYLHVAARIRAGGMVNRQVPVRLLWETSPGNEETVAEQQLDVASNSQQLSVEFDYVPEIPGEYKLTLEVPELPGELTATNNRMSTYVRVLKGGVNVLYLEGFPPRPEQNFIGRALAGAPEIDRDVLLVDPRRPETRPANLAERLKPGVYQVYLLGNLDAAAFRPEELQALAQAVDQGAGLMMLGGPQSFGAGGYADTPLAPLLPVRTSRLERQGIDEPLRGDLHLPGPLPMQPTEAGFRHFALMLAGEPSQNRTLWSQLPPLDGANRFEAVKPAAIVLAESPAHHPLLVYQPYGQGRVVAFAGDSTWRWVMQGFQTAHARFWRQMVLWLARKDASLEGNVWIELAERRYRPGQPVRFRLGAQLPTGQLAGQADWRITVRLPDGSTQTVEPGSEDGQPAATFRETAIPGEYTIDATASVEGRQLGTANARFLVFREDLELDQPAADQATLDAVAAATGGKSLAVDGLPAVLDQLARQAESLEVRTEQKRPLWDNWPMLLLVVGLFSVDWYLRRRWAMV